MQETGLGQVETGVAGVRLHDDTRDLPRVACKGSLHGGGVVVRQHQRQRGILRRYPRAVRLAVGQGPAAGADQQAVRVAVVTARELDDVGPPGETARQSHGTHGGLRAAVGHAHLLDVREKAADGLRHVHLHPRRDAVAQPARHRLLHGLQHTLRRVAQNGRPPSAHVIDVLPPVLIAEVGPGGFCYEERRTPQAAEGTHGRIDPARNDPAGPLKQLIGNRHVPSIRHARPACKPELRTHRPTLLSGDAAPSAAGGFR